MPSKQRRDLGLRPTGSASLRFNLCCLGIINEDVVASTTLVCKKRNFSMRKIEGYNLHRFDLQ